MSDMMKLASDFAVAIVDRNTDRAHAMLTQGLRGSMQPAELLSELDVLADDMGGVNGIGEPMKILDDWPGKAANELAMIYVPLLGDVYSEAVTLTIANEDDRIRIGAIEWGRP
ncbi:MAG: hypothetical protein KJO82_06170 [Gammaproteobacteria bacterium]|nr:hypothetical protein [Gammaproteobacteria bacterium]